MLETIEAGGGAFHQALTGHRLKWEEGFILPPEDPGLGIAFDEELARAHPYNGNQLHLQMQEAPCDYVGANNFAGGAPRE
jgi:hypothetical protein